MFAAKSSISKDHPRIHGEHHHQMVRYLYTLGSPPHTRGTPRLNNIRASIGRITPAYTGNTCLLYFVNCLDKDHPRIHGEHAILFALIYAFSGSPPHTRGTHNIKGSSRPMCRITPAYTGNTPVHALSGILL